MFPFVGLCRSVIAALTGVVTPATPTVFENYYTDYFAICQMDATHAIVCYYDYGGGMSRATACCLTLSGDTVTAGTPVAFDTGGQCAYTSVCAMDSTHAIVTYDDIGNSDKGTACCLTLSGTTISAGTPVVFEDAVTNFTSVIALDSTHAIVTYRDYGNSGYGTACCLSLSGTTITAGTPAVFESANTIFTSVGKIDSTHALVAYQDTGNSYYGTACVLSLSGTTITAATPAVFEAGRINGIALCMLSATKALAFYPDYGNSSYVTAVLITISGTTLSAGTPAVVESVGCQDVSACTIDEEHVLACWKTTATGNAGKTRCLIISGSSISSGSAASFDSPVGSTAVCKMDDRHGIVVYKDTASSLDLGTACCITLS